MTSLPFDLVDLQAATTDELVVRFAMEGPKPESLFPPMRHGLPDAYPGCLFGERLAVCGERLHHQGIGMQAVDLGKVQRRDGLSQEAGGGERSDGVGHEDAWLLSGCVRF